MTRRAVVTVADVSIERVDDVEPSASRRLIASFSLTSNAAEPTVQLAGTLRTDALTSAASYHFVRGFRTACEGRGSVMPAGLVVRATSQIAPNEHEGLSAAAVVAGVAAANALFGLGLGDHEVATLSLGVLEGGSNDVHTALPRLAHVVASHRVTVHHVCEDDRVS